MASNNIQNNINTTISDEEREYFASIGVKPMDENDLRLTSLIMCNPLQFYEDHISEEEWKKFCEGIDSGSAHHVYEIEKHDYNMIFTRKGKKYSAMLRHMVNHGNAKSGKTMRQIYRYCYQYLFDRDWTQFYPPVFNPKAKYIVELGDDNHLYIKNVTKDKRYRLLSNNEK